MKFKVGQMVNIIPLNKRGVVLHAFLFKVYGKPDERRYNVKHSSGPSGQHDEVYEVCEDELS